VRVELSLDVLNFHLLGRHFVWGWYLELVTSFEESIAREPRLANFTGRSGLFVRTILGFAEKTILIRYRDELILSYRVIGTDSKRGYFLFLLNPDIMKSLFLLDTGSLADRVFLFGFAEGIVRVRSIGRSAVPKRTIFALLDAIGLSAVLFSVVIMG
jgi:hypothetical protein